jgi:Rapid ALkalinization Factor (RALF)
MALRVATTVLLSLLLLSTSILTTTSSPMESSWALSFNEPDFDNLLEGLPTCNGKVGDCDGDSYEEVGTDLEAAVRRGLAWRKRYISYDALKKNRVPCNRRGQSYYNCQRGRQANPYRRGCSFITKCARIMN